MGGQDGTSGVYCASKEVDTMGSTFRTIPTASSTCGSQQSLPGKFVETLLSFDSAFLQPV